MIKLIYLFLISISFTSSLEIYGTGNRYDFISAMGLGLGGSYHFSDDLNHINPTSISTYWRSDLTRASLSTLFFSNMSGRSNKGINPSMFLFSFPVSKNKNLTFGLTPYTRANIKIEESSGNIIGQSASELLPALNSMGSYYVYGGLSNMFSAFSIKLNNQNSMGIKINYLFGSQLHLNKMTLFELNPTFDNALYSQEEYDSTYQIIFNNFSGYSIQWDWALELKKHEFALSMTSMGPIDVKHKVYYDLYEISDPIERFIYSNYDFLNVESGDDLLQYSPHHSIEVKDEIDLKAFIGSMLSRINDFSLGYHHRLGNSGFLIEHHRKNLFNSNTMRQDGISILNNIHPVTESYHVGIYQKYSNSKINSWESISIRVGGYYKNIASNGVLNEEQFSDIALTAGIGVKFNNNKSLVDLGIKFGKVNHFLFDDEYYCKGILTIDIGERWFARLRRK